MAEMTKEKLAKANELSNQIDLLSAQVEKMKDAKFIRVHTSPSEFIQFDAGDEKLFIEQLTKQQEEKLKKLEAEFKNCTEG